MPFATVTTATPVLFLWVFAPNPNGELIDEVRRRFGPVEMLQGGGQLVTDLAEMPSVLFGRADQHIEESEAEVLARIAGFKRRRVGLPIPDGYGGRMEWWSSNTMLCSDGVWQFALDRLVERNEVFVMDLTDFSAEHAGCEYEIGVLLDRVPARRCLFVIGLETDPARVIDELRQAWETMAATSPNRDPANGPLRVIRGEHLPRSAPAGRQEGARRRCRAGALPRTAPPRSGRSVAPAHDREGAVQAFTASMKTRSSRRRSSPAGWNATSVAPASAAAAKRSRQWAAVPLRLTSTAIEPVMTVRS